MAFQPLDPRQHVASTRRNLPHWQQHGATYFVTYRLSDSLPADACAQLGELRKLNDADHFAWIESYLDAGAGRSILGEPRHASLLESTLRHFDRVRYSLGAFAIMPNHVHVLVQPFAGESLTRIVHGWKSYTANQLQRSSVIAGRVWQEESFDRIIRDFAELHRLHEYILSNPAEAHLKPGTFICGEGSANWFGAE
jgi:REP element-mobilizing transposase RayT